MVRPVVCFVHLVCFLRRCSDSLAIGQTKLASRGFLFEQQCSFRCFCCCCCKAQLAGRVICDQTIARQQRQRNRSNGRKREAKIVSKDKQREHHRKVQRKRRGAFGLSGIAGGSFVRSVGLFAMVWFYLRSLSKVARKFAQRPVWPTKQHLLLEISSSQPQA